MSKKHIVFIINPRSGTERQKKIEAAVETYLDKGIYSYELLHTEYEKHGTLLAKDAALKGAYSVVAVGGDGSVNDVAAGLLGTPSILGIIPKGSGNGMSRTLNIPRDVAEAVKVINNGKTLNIDIAFANNKPFVSNAGVAFDALVARKFATSKKRGLFNYTWLVAKHLWAYKELEWSITVDGEKINERAFMVIVANGQQFGYNFKIAPMASITDGVLDIIIVKKFPKILGGIITLRAMNGTITSSPYVRHYKGKTITIYNPSLCLMQTDGDASDCEQMIHFRVQQAAQRVFVP
jgi:YegS/Rv2252/BmrU family lipid kinase